MNEQTFVLKGTICYSNSLTELSITENGYLVCEDGRCAGVFDELPEKFAGISCTDFGDELIIPGLTDLHLHAPQYTFRASGMDLELLDWLNTYTFPQEARYEDTEFAKEAYSIFTEDMKKSPNTRACIFGTLHVPATEILMEQLDKTGIKAMVGKVNMDRNGSPQLQEESAQASADATVQWIKDTLDKFENVKPILTPRFTPSCSDALMEKLSEIQKKYHLPMQSHLSENFGEIAWVKELCPNTHFYGEAYSQFDLFGGDCPTIMAHCVHSSDEEIALMKKQGVYIAHCPQSNTNLASGISPVRRYLEAVARVAEPFLAKNGGPILMTQLENEYGSYQRKDRKYMEWLKAFWSRKGFGPFYTSDGAGEHFLKGVVLPDVAVGLDPGLNDGHWKVANKCNPGVPVFSSETYPGWLRHWGEGNWAPTPGVVNHVRWFMDKGRSFSLFVFHGGTNFGFSAGANNGGPGKYQPDLTSYDYGSPVDEQGRMNEYYAQMREIILEKLPPGAAVPEPPADIPAMEIPEFTPAVHAGLWENLPKPFRSKFPQPPYFEQWNQNQGIAVYSTAVPAGPPETLEFTNVNDYAQVYLDGELVGTLDRRLGQKSVKLPERRKPGTLEILVEAMGHINFHISMESDRKGVYGPVKLGTRELKNWTVRALPLKADSMVRAPKGKGPSQKREGAHFRAVVNIEEPQDTFLDMSRYVKGYVWVNGINVGRYWNVGPQLRLYVPAPFLKKGENVIDILDLHEKEPKPVRGMKERNKEPGKINTKNLDNQW